MNKMKWVLLVLPSVFLIGCASPAKKENMIYNPRNRLPYDRALNHEVRLKAASGGKKTNPMWTSEISTEAFSEAVKSSLKGQGLYSEYGRYHLVVNMGKTKQPYFGINFKVTTHVNYVLTDSSDNTVVFDETIVAPFTAKMGDAFYGAKRLRLANEGSGKENIKGLLEKLSELKISTNQISIQKQ